MKKSILLTVVMFLLLVAFAAPAMAKVRFDVRIFVPPIIIGGPGHYPPPPPCPYPRHPGYYGHHDEGYWVPGHWEERWNPYSGRRERVYCPGHFESHPYHR